MFYIINNCIMYQVNYYFNFIFKRNQIIKKSRKNQEKMSSVVDINSLMRIEVTFVEFHLK